MTSLRAHRTWNLTASTPARFMLMAATACCLIVTCVMAQTSPQGDKQTPASALLEFERVWIEQARRTVEQLADPEMKGNLLMEIAGVHLNWGDVAAARTVADGIADVTYKESALAAIAASQARAGDIAAARQTLQAITSANTQEFALARIAGAQAHAGDVDGALQTLSAISDADKLDEAKGDLAESLAKAGNTAGAVAVVEHISPQQRDQALFAIMGAQLAEDQFTEAMRTAEAFDASEEFSADAAKFFSLIMLGFPLIESGETTHAREIIAAANSAVDELEKNPEFQKEILADPKFGELLGMVRVMGRVADRDAAKAKQEAGAIADIAERDKRLGMIASAQAMLGDFIGATATTEMISTPAARSSPLRVIAVAYARKGDFQKARPMADAISDQSQRRMALETIASLQAKAGFVANALDTARSIDPRKPPSSSPLHDIINILLETGDTAGAVEVAEAYGDEDNWIKAGKLAGISRVQARAGHAAAARMTVRAARDVFEAGDEQDKRLMISEVAWAMGYANDVAGAKAWIDPLPDLYMRARGQLAVAEGLAQRNQEVAARWRDAADKGDAQAQYSIAVLYAAGRGVTRDYVEALRWLDLAAANEGASAELKSDIETWKTDIIEVQASIAVRDADQAKLLEEKAKLAKIKAEQAEPEAREAELRAEKARLAQLEAEARGIAPEAHTQNEALAPINEPVTESVQHFVNLSGEDKARLKERPIEELRRTGRKNLGLLGFYRGYGVDKDFSRPNCDAVHSYEACLDRFGATPPEVYLDLALAYLIHGRFDSAIAVLERGQMAVPAGSDAANVFPVFLEDARNLKSSLTSARDSLRKQGIDVTYPHERIFLAAFAAADAKDDFLLLNIADAYAGAFPASQVALRCLAEMNLGYWEHHAIGQSSVPTMRAHEVIQRGEEALEKFNALDKDSAYPAIRMMQHVLLTTAPADPRRAVKRMGIGSQPELPRLIQIALIDPDLKHEPGGTGRRAPSRPAGETTNGERPGRDGRAPAGQRGTALTQEEYEARRRSMSEPRVLVLPKLTNAQRAFLHYGKAMFNLKGDDGWANPVTDILVIAPLDTAVKLDPASKLYADTLAWARANEEHINQTKRQIYDKERAEGERSARAAWGLDAKTDSDNTLGALLVYGLMQGMWDLSIEEMRRGNTPESRVGAEILDQVGCIMCLGMGKKPYSGKPCPACGGDGEFEW
jgi:hypothetical protein